MKITSLSLNDDLHKAAIAAANERCVLVFPTRSAANYARQREMDNWRFGDCTFISMEDFKEALILPETSVLTDEKRLLCLYLVMGEETRDFFHILKYGDIVQWGKHFFDFFEELAEECVEVDSLAELKDSGVFHLQMWQEIYLERILQIRADYYSYITALGFTDKIFFLGKPSFYSPWQHYTIVFVNQYYYSALEKELITFLEELDNQVLILYHGLEVNWSNGNWKLQDFNLEATWKDLLKKPEIAVIESENEDQMALAFLAYAVQQGNDNRPGAIIDSSFHQKSYSRYFEARQFRLPEFYPIADTGLFKMLAAIQAGLTAMQQTGSYLPVSLLAKLLSTPWFLPYFIAVDKTWQTKDAYEVIHAEIWRELSVFISQDYLYVDLQMFGENDQSLLKRVMTAYLGLVEAFSRISSIKMLCELIDAPNGLQVAALITENERDFTDLLPAFWARVANFSAIETLEIIPSWQVIFGGQSCATGIMELFISFLKSAKITYHSEESKIRKWEITNLLDARNRSYPRVAFFQMIEGIIPSNPAPVWLFNETQRARLGLKNYTDIRAWERYYFFRLLLTSAEASCFTYRNMDKDIGPSSFVGELEQLYKEQELKVLPKFTFSIPSKAIYTATCKQILAEAEDAALCALEKTPEAEFFVIPSEPECDYSKDKTLCASASSILQLLKNPFLWYIETRSHIQPKGWEAPETIGAKLFGNIMHAYFSRILGEYRGKHTGLDKLESIFGNRELLQNGLVEVINSRDFRYQIPKNYNADFLSEIISERLSDSLYQFYTGWLKMRLERKAFTLIPEEEKMTGFEEKYKQLGTVKAFQHDFIIALRGKADLRIETEHEAMIIDFKTGNHDYRQLVIYEWVYYLLDNTLQEDEISSRFWNILDPSKPVDKIDHDKRSRLKEDILSTFLDCLNEGYGFGKKVSDRQRLQNITRTDLYVKEKEATDARI
ncbi:MAG: PD-(D/E)XK nuclease family protein [Candidatus Cloacimonas sp.]|jgi:hypothetical protein|nr:PD-(D/E)XK nuclease family protein [Candidatus Cloacimonas sp.]